MCLPEKLDQNPLLQACERHENSWLQQQGPQRKSFSALSLQFPPSLLRVDLCTRKIDKTKKKHPIKYDKYKKEILEIINNISRKQRKNQTSSRAGCEGFEKVLEEAFGFGHLIMKKNWETLRILF